METIVIRGLKSAGGNQELLLCEPDVLRFAKPILAIHGMWGTYRVWENYAKFFTNAGFRFLALTLRHHFYGNQGVKELGKTSILDYTADVMQSIKYLSECGLPKINIAPLPLPIIFGHSMGGLIAQIVSSHGLAFAAVLLNSAPPAGVPLRPNIRYQLTMLRYLPYFLLQKPFKPSFAAMSHFVLNNMPKTERRGYYNRMVYESGRAAWEIRTEKIQIDFSKITCPLLIIGAENDRIVPPQTAYDIFKKTVHLDALLWIYSDFAHRIQMEPGWYNPATHIYHWLKERIH